MVTVFKSSRLPSSPTPYLSLLIMSESYRTQQSKSHWTQCQHYTHRRRANSRFLPVPVRSHQTVSSAPPQSEPLLSLWLCIQMTKYAKAMLTKERPECCIVNTNWRVSQNQPLVSNLKPNTHYLSSLVLKLPVSYWNIRRLTTSMYNGPVSDRAIIRRVRKTAKRLLLTSSYISPSVRAKQLGSHWTHFDEIRYLSFVRKYVKKTQVSLTSKNTGYFTWRCFHIYDNISLNSSQN